MVERGDVVRLKRRLGFAPHGEADAFVVIQADTLNSIFATLVCVPLDPATSAFVNMPIAPRISREEAGSHVDHVAIPWRIAPISADALSPGPVGRLRPETLRALEETLALVLDLP